MNVQLNPQGYLSLLLITLVLGACQSSGLVNGSAPTGQISATASQTAEAAEKMPPNTSEASTVAQITIRGVQVQEGAYIQVRGQSDLPEGACILTQLEQEGEGVSWWPDGSCATVNNGQWQLAVQLGETGAPQNLDAKPQYAVRAWYQDDPTVAAQPFPFDLQGPPPASTELSPSLTPES